MSKDRLVLDDWHSNYRIVWFLGGQELGAALGDSPTKPEQPESEHWAAEAAVWDRADGRDELGLYWRSEGAARKALAAAKRAVAEFCGAKPWPEWAKTAHANGWHPPRGWTP